MSCTIRNILGLGLMVAALAGCDDGGGSGAQGSGGSSNSGGSSSSGGENGGDDGVEGTLIFTGSGSWIDGAGPAGQFGIQGAFFVLEDSVKDGVPVNDGLTHTDLTPDEFGEGIDPCVSGTVAMVTNAAGEQCDPAGSDCEWSAIWGGGIGLNLNETGGENSTQQPLDLGAAGVTGFSFRLSGDVEGATVRFKIKDQPNEAEDFCVAVMPNGVSTVRFNELKHMCWGSDGTLSVDTTKALQLQWQIVTTASRDYNVNNFCIEELAVVTD